MDSLDGQYKDGWANVRETFEITAESRTGPQTVSVRARLPTGTEIVRIDPYFDPPRPDGSEIWWNMGIEHVAVRDGDGVVVSRLELETVAAELDLCGSHEPRYGHTSTRDTFYEAWFCTQRVPVRIPEDGVYDIELVVWVQYQHHDVANQRRMLDLSAGGYQEGDTWYRDMRAPGFGDAKTPNADNSVQWLARRIVADERFATAAVEFWWPALMGSEVAEPPEDEGDADFEGRLLAANAQGAEVERLAGGFRHGFHGGPAYNLKDLLVEMVLTKWFRADEVEDTNPVRRIALRDAGARRLLTPEELAHKTDALTGVRWERRPNQGWPYQEWLSGLTNEFRLLYGGIDSDGVTERARDLTPVMAGVAKRHAMQIACAVVTRDFYLRTGSEQRLLAGIDRHTTAPGAIRAKLVELHDTLLGVEVTPHSPDVERAYELFVDVLERKRARRDDWFDHWNCYAGAHDRSFFEGLLDDIIVVNENEEGHRWYDFDWNRVNRYLDRIDWRDPTHAAQAWVVALAYLLMDYRYLYL